MRRTTFSVVFFCKKARISKKGKAPIYARITTSGLSTEIYTRCQIEPERWNQRLERSLHRDKVALQINGIVDSHRANILAAYDALIRKGRYRTASPSRSGSKIRAAPPDSSLPNSRNTAKNGSRRSAPVSHSSRPTSTTVCCVI